MKRREINFHKHFDEIFASEKLAVDKLAEGFGFVTSRILAESDREMEILRAMGDKGGLVKEQIKHSTVQHVMEAFGECYFRTTGEQWERDEDEE